MGNIFANLIKNEDTFTDGLINIIDFSDKFSVEFFKLLRKSLGLEDSFEFGSPFITTQMIIDGKRPDIVIEMNNAVLFIEVKIENGTGLQSAQQELYKNCFDKYGKKERYFLFLVPKGYPKRKELKEITERKDNRITAGIIDWEQIIEKCFNPILGENEVRDKAVETVEWFILNQYRRLLKEKLKIMSIEFNEKEKSMVGQKEMISAYIKLYWLPQQIINKKSNWKFTINGNELAIKLWIDKSKYSGTSIGFIIKNNGEGKKLSDYFEIMVWNKEISEKVAAECKLQFPGKSNKENEFCYEFLSESIDESKELSQQMINILEKIMEERSPSEN